MKIRKVRICNIHSLAGCHELDFTQPPFVGAGLFVITGPTGAGKSTLLDAITLALYGKIARHDGHFKEVVSHGAPEASATVEFEAKGKLVRSTWAITRKTRGPHKGRLNEATRSVAIRERNGQWRSVAEKKKEVDEFIHQSLGLTFEQFTRTVFLPQGAFTNFLKAKGSERADILEGLTGTEIYGELSVLCAQIKKEKETLLEKEKALLEAIPLLSDEALLQIRQQRASLDETIASTTKKIRQLTDLLERAQAHKAALDTAAQLEKEIEETAAALQQAQAQRTPLDKQLDTAQQQLDAHLKRKHELELRWEKMQAHDRKIKEKESHLRELEAQMRQLIQKRHDLKEEVEQTRTQLDQLEQKRNSVHSWMAHRPYLDKLKSELSALKADWKRVETIDKQLSALNTEIRSLTHSLEKQRELVAQLEAKGKKLESEKAALRSACEMLHIQPDALAYQISKCQKRHADLQEEISLGKDALQKLEALHELDEKKRKLKAHIWKTTTALQDLQHQLETHLQALTKQQARVKEAERQRDLELLAQDFAKHRRLLKEGEPCPLCGARHHPVLRDQVVQPRLGQAEKKLQELKALLAQQEAQIVTCEKKQERLKQELHFYKTQLSDCESRHDALVASLKRSSSSMPSEHAPETWPHKLAQLETEAQEAYRTLQKLQQLNSRWNEWKEKSHAHKEKKTTAQADLKNLQYRQITLQKRIQELKAERDKLLRSTHKQLKAIGIKMTPSPALWAQLEEELNALDVKYAALQEIEQERAAKRAALEEKKLQMREVVDAISTLEKILEKEKNFLRKESAARIKLFGESSVSEERAAWEARMHHYRGQVDKLRGQISKVEAQIKEWQGMLKEKRSRHAALSAKAAQLRHALDGVLEEKIPTAVVATKWQQQKIELEKRRDALLQQKGQLEQQLNAHRQAELEAAIIREKLRALVREAARWQALSELIGSHDGKKFRTLAQALTLRRLIAHANRQLDRMLQGRYRLHADVDMRKKTVELELFIIDRFQADAMRPVRTLSGGESFLVSLALALGLSEMAGGSIEIESLFIDEGFGTLDDKNLDTAMEVLESLRNSGRLVGVISHVKELKARIPVQVEIVPQGSGLSAIRVKGQRLHAAI